MKLKGEVLEARPAHGAAAVVDLAELIAIFRRRKWSILWTVVTVTALAGWIGFQREAIYTATADILIRPEQNEFVDPDTQKAGVQQTLAEVTTQLEVLRSQGFLAKLVDSHNLLAYRAFNPDSAAGDGKARGNRSVDSNAVSWLGGDWLDKLAWLSPGRWFVTQSPAEESFRTSSNGDEAIGYAEEAADHYDRRRAYAIAVLAQGLTVTQPGGSFLVQITYSSPDPRLAADIANAAAELFVEQRRQVQLEASKRGAAWLAKRVADLQEELAEAEQVVRQFRTENDLVDPEASRLLVGQQLAELNKELVSLRALHAEKQSQLTTLREKVEAGEGIDAVSEIAPSTLLADLQRQETQLAQAEAELRGIYGPKHPRYLASKEEQARLAGQIEAVVNRIVRGLETDLRIVSAREQAVAAELETLRQRSREQSSLSGQLEEYESKLATTRALHESALLRLKEKSEQAEFLQSKAVIASPALVPVVPSNGGPMRFLFVGFIASALLGTMVALVRERLDTRFRTEDQIRQDLGLELLGAVPHLSRRMRTRMPPHCFLMERPRSAYAEGIRAIYTGLTAHHPGGQVALISSASPHEGKTTLALSLAVFAARIGRRVLLVDFDLRRPEVGRILGAEASMTSEPGVVDCLLHDVALQEAVLHHTPTGIDVLPVRRRPRDPATVLSSSGLDRMITEARADYDFIVLDSPPVLAVLDAQVLAQRADTVLFVANWERTSRAAALNALGRLSSLGDKIAGVALFGVKLHRYAQDIYCSSGKDYRRIAKYYVD